MLRKIAACFLVAVCFSTSAQTISRISNSPYPASSTPDTLYLLNLGHFTQSQQLSIITLQGLLARTKPQIMLNHGSALFQSDLEHYGVVYDSSYFNDFAGLIAHFKNNFAGYLLCNLSDSTTNAAISVCAFYNGIALTAADTGVTNSLAIPMLADLRDKGPYWVLNNYSDSLSKKVVTYQGVDKYAYLSDYSVFANAFHFWDFIAFTPLVRQAFSRVGVNGVMMGWGPDEHTTVYTASQYGLHVHASDWASNLSTYSNFNVSTHQKDNNDDTTVIPGKHTVCFVMTDGDNIQWLLNDFSTNPGWYGSHRRGACNLGWTVSPALAELAPTALKYLYDSAATSPGGRDYFICGPSGLGYYYPSNFNSLDSAAAITQRMMKKAGLSILNVISDGYSDSQMLPYLSQPNIDAVFFYTYDYWYAGLRGFATCINGKPVITPRFAFAGGVYDVQSLADTLNKMPPNPYSSDGYSLIAVNVWSKNIDSVISCVNLLDTNVRVVTPDVFVKLYKAGVNCTTTAINSTVQNAASLALSVSPNPARALALVNFTLPSTGIVTLSVYNMQGQEINTVFNGQLAAGQQQVKILTGQLPAGVYICRLNYNGSSQTATMVIAR